MLLTESSGVEFFAFFLPNEDCKVPVLNMDEMIN